MSPNERRQFDELVEKVLAELPESVGKLLDETPLIVEDYPSKQLRRELGLDRRDELCGLYSGVPLTEPEERKMERLPDHILIFREGILSEAEDDQGRVRRGEVERQIRITILHELGHHHGLDEEDLEELGYG